jgi:hypothetical protein
MTRSRYAPTLLFALVALLAAPARAEPAGDPGWEFTVTPYLWLFNLKGDVGAAGQESSVDTSLFDLFQNNDSVLGVEANLQARNGPWTLLADPTWLRIQDDFHAAGDLGADLDADVTANAVIVDLMVMREVWRLHLGEPVVEKGMPQRGLALDLLGGTRIWVIEMDADFDVSTPGPIFDELSRDLDSTQSWADPVLGARATWDVTDRMHLVMRGDIGGFHVGSDLTSELWANLVYDFGLFGRDAFAALGYRGLYADYDDNGGFMMQAWLHGPTIGMGVRF